MQGKVPIERKTTTTNEAMVLKKTKQNTRQEQNQEQTNSSIWNRRITSSF